MYVLVTSIAALVPMVPLPLGVVRRVSHIVSVDPEAWKVGVGYDSRGYVHDSVVVHFASLRSRKGREFAYECLVQGSVASQGPRLLLLILVRDNL